MIDLIQLITLSQMEEQSIQSIQELLLFFRETNQRLFYLGPIYGTTILNIHDFMPSFEIITCSDPYFGALPFVTVPQSLKDHQGCEIECQNLLASNPEVIAYMRSKDPNPNIIFMINLPETERICKENGFKIWGSNVELQDYLGNKVKIIDLLRKAEIPFIPNVCSKIESYNHLLQMTQKFKTSKIVVQDQMGYSGIGTMFINNEEDYKLYQTELESGKDFRIMGFRHLKCLTIDSVSTRTGTFVGPLMSDLIGHKELTIFPAGYCGNEIRKSYFNDPVLDGEIRSEILKLAEKFGNYLYREKLFKGFFGCDFAVDVETREIFFLEINARLTGTQALSSMLYEAQGHKFPQVLYHCAEYMGIKLNLDVQAINNQWIDPNHYQNQASYLVFICVDSSQLSIPYTFPAGFWKMENDDIKFTGKIEFRLSELKDDEIFFTPSKAYAKGNIIMKKLVQDQDFKLTEEAKSIIAKFIKLRLNDTILKS